MTLHVSWWRVFWLTTRVRRMRRATETGSNCQMSLCQLRSSRAAANNQPIRNSQHMGPTFIHPMPTALVFNLRRDYEFRVPQTPRNLFSLHWCPFDLHIQFFHCSLGQEHDFISIILQIFPVSNMLFPSLSPTSKPPGSLLMSLLNQHTRLWLFIPPLTITPTLRTWTPVASEALDCTIHDSVWKLSIYIYIYI